MRIRDLEMVTSLPSFLQENRGFKSQEQSEQPDYETPDDVANKPARHWLINDLVLFIDNEDMPRIPRKLFEDVCRINVAGVPGPIYRGHLDAMKHFLKIVVFIFFVFVVIVSFGSIVEVIIRCLVRPLRNVLIVTDDSLRWSGCTIEELLKVAIDATALIKCYKLTM